MNRAAILCGDFAARHKTASSAFSRRRKLDFSTVAILLLRRSVKSLQLFLNEFFDRLSLERVTASAYSQARRKFSHTAFIELLEVCTLQPFYADGNFETFQGRRLLSIDGSKVRLPKSSELQEEFGLICERNNLHETWHTEAKISILYDLRNELPLHGVIARGRTGERQAAASHFEKIAAGDLILCDRGYPSFEFFFGILERKADFIIRCPRQRFADGAGLFEENIPSRLRTFPKPSYVLDDSLPDELTLRFVRIELANGEIEVLVTSLLDEERYPNTIFKELYHERWGVETFFYVLKSRLALEHFTGRTVEAIKQDFHSTIYLAALESILTKDAGSSLELKTVEHKQKVNKAISFHVLKDRAFEILLNRDVAEPETLKQLTELFQQQPTLVRPGRVRPRRRKTRNTYSWASVNFQRNVKKQIF